MSALRTLRVETAPAYEVVVGPGALAELDARTSAFSARAVLTDENVEPLYARQHAPSGVPVLSVPAGEDSKTFVVLEHVLDFLAEHALDRKACLVAFGGGVIGDLGGFAASVYQRGIAFAQVPTTLLAQVDSSVGGKTAVNLERGKNLAGTFHQPCVVLADTRVLATLSDDEYRSGLGEVVKTALLEGEDALLFLERETRSILARDPDVLADLVLRCVKHKAAVVARDPREAGERKTLNLGHTFAHAIEHVAGYGVVPHGIAVGVGLVLAARLSHAAGIAPTSELELRIERLLHAFGMPASLAELSKRGAGKLPADALLRAMRHDKKSASGTPRFVLIERPGSIRFDVENTVPEQFFTR